MLITRLWRAQRGDYFFLSSKSRSGKWRDHCFSRKQFGDVQQFIEDNKDKDLYWCPNGFKERRRVKPFVVPGVLLYADLDEASPREITPKPTIAIESSPGRYVGVWVVDKATEELNRRLTYSVGADVSGWDITQVLRVPGTTNYKYESLPKVRTLWIDGPNYKSRDIERKLPKEIKSNGNEEGLAAEVFKKHEADLPQWLRRELVAGKPTVGSRSDMVWKLQNELVELGLTREECFLLIRSSPWNKFKDRHDGDGQLRRELDKIINKHLSGAKSESYQFLSRSLADVETEELDWIWYPYLARGELSILEGDPGLGKSYLAEIVSGHLVDGRRLPSVKRIPVTQGKVAYFDMENSAGTVTKKRLADNNVRRLQDFYQEEEVFTIDNEEKLLKVFDAIERQKPVLVVFDTLNTYIGKADIHKSSESQQAMGVFREIAKRYNCAVLVLRHLTKGSKTSALYRGQGSIAFAGLARVVMTVGVSPEDPETRVMAVTKLNVTKKPRALSFNIESLPDKLKSQDRSRFVWGDFVDFTSDQILQTNEGSGSDRDAAAEFLRDTLADGGVDLRKIEKMAETRSLSMRTVHRAAEALGVKKKLSGFGKDKHSVWALTTESTRDSRA